ncbi:(4Fe-4S)-binding protein [Microtetraspora sp. NBRC 16547]|uniref:ferredoxin n=1 Tax=Microtetraspora sp. NBRC 16547 TaxID=3030993 RepID=UPI0024A4E5DB|nr:(4Fe-4S)-binding protein [Microtetraspora sp. NBRC 16547]GLX00332.1 ferredoxin [Microtetraspora sp. NBRC 16547]
MRIIADTGRCIGAGMCVLALGEVFDQSEDDGTVVLLDAEPPASMAGAVRRAVQLCPSGALSIAETSGGDQDAAGGVKGNGD